MKPPESLTDHYSVVNHMDYEKLTNTPGERVIVWNKDMCVFRIGSYYSEEGRPMHYDDGSRNGNPYYNIVKANISNCEKARDTMINHKLYLESLINEFEKEIEKLL